MTDIQKKLGIPHFSLHKMRHFFASYMHQLGMSDKQIQEAGGWKTDGIMKTVYQHAMNMDEAKKKMADSIGGLVKEKVSE
jgi:integrase